MSPVSRDWHGACCIWATLTKQKMDAYREYANDIYGRSSESVLHGPNGFRCTLKRAQRRMWENELRPLVDELNRLHDLLVDHDIRPDQ